MAIYQCKVRVGKIIYTANMGKDLIDDLIEHEKKSAELNSFDDGHVHKDVTFKEYSKKVEVVAYHPLYFENDMDVEEPEVNFYVLIAYVNLLICAPWSKLRLWFIRQLY